MDKRDELLQKVTPSVMVPRFGDFEPLAANGHRFLVASDGMWLEIKRAWLYARIHCAPIQGHVPIPYGTVTPCVELLCGQIPKQIMEEFQEQAIAALPNETAATIIWHEQTGQMRLLPRVELKTGKAYVTIEAPILAPHEHLVMDIHSHGKFIAGFSSTDNKYDETGVYLAGVIGNVDTDHPSYAYRVCALGMFINL